MVFHSNSLPGTPFGGSARHRVCAMSCTMTLLTGSSNVSKSRIVRDTVRFEVTFFRQTSKIVYDTVRFEVAFFRQKNKRVRDTVRFASSGDDSKTLAKSMVLVHDYFEKRIAKKKVCFQRKHELYGTRWDSERLVLCRKSPIV